MPEATLNPGQNKKRDEDDIARSADELENLYHAPSAKRPDPVSADELEKIYATPGNQPSSPPGKSGGDDNEDSGNARRDEGQEESEPSSNAIENFPGPYSHLDEPAKQHEAQVGRGYVPHKPHEKHSRNRFMQAFTKKRAAVGGGIIGTIIAALFGLSTIHGPLQIMHLSQLLQQDFFGEERSTTQRIHGLYRWARTGDIGETRLGYVGSRIFRNAESKLAKIGYGFEKTKVRGQLTAITLDHEKNPRYQSMSLEEARTAWAQDNGVPTNRIQIDGDKLRIEVRHVGIGGKRTAIAVTLGQLSDGRVLSTIKFRTLGKFYNVPSWLHPLKRIAAGVDDRLENRLSRTKWRQERNAKINTRSQQAQDRLVKVKGRLSTGAAVAGGALFLADGVCVAKDVASEIPAINRENIAVPAIISAGDLMALGDQPKYAKDKDVTLAQLRAVTEGFTDKNGKSIWDAEAIRAKNGGKGGEKADEGLRQAFSPDNSAANFEKTLDENFTGALCSDIGRIVSGVAGVGLFFVPGAGWAAKGIGAAAGVAAMAVITNVLPTILADEPLVATFHEGPKGGNIDAYGSREAANTAFRASAGVALNSTQSAAIDKLQFAHSQEEFRSKSVASRLFDVYDRRSATARLIDNTSTDPRRIATAVISAPGSIKNTLSTLFISRAYAEPQPYNYGFPRYGFSEEELNNPILQDPYENADEVVKLLDGGDSEKYVKKALECFGVDIQKGNNGWEAVAVSDIAPTSRSYTEASCNEGSNEWLRIRMFIFDSRTMDAYACYEGDDQACSNIGVSTNAAPESTQENVAGNAQEIAQQILDNPRIDLTNFCRYCTEDIKNTAEGKQAYGDITIDINILKFIAELGKSTDVDVNSITGAGSGHSDGSEHYKGNAVDFECNGISGKVLDRVGSKYGIRSNFERCDEGVNHWHYSVSGR